MSYLLIDDQFPENSKVLGLSHVAFRFHITALCYCARNLTDGHVNAHAVRIIGAIVCTQPKRWTAELVAARLWKEDVESDGFWIHDYLKHNPSSEKVKADRAAAKNRMRRIRTGARSDEQPAEHSEEQAGNVHDPLPSPPLIALAIPPALPHYAGDDSHESGDKTEALIRACGGSTEAAQKIRRTIAARGSSYETVVRALDAALAPARDPLGVALSILAPRNAA